MSEWVNIGHVTGPQGPQGEAGRGFPSGGSAGQVLRKASAADYDTVWADPAAPRKVSVALTAQWSGSGPYTQAVALSGLTANSKVDLQPDAAALAQLLSDGVQALYLENSNGSLTAYALGAAPTAALTVQATVTEVGA